VQGHIIGILVLGSAFFMSSRSNPPNDHSSLEVGGEQATTIYYCSKGSGCSLLETISEQALDGTCRTSTNAIS
jgi:hypothetical protein